MRLKNKKTGEIGWLYCNHISVPKKMTVFSEDKDLSAPHWDYDTLAELNEDWTDYEEPKEYWYIYGDGCLQSTHLTHTMKEEMKEIGNYFSSREEAELAVRKLKAWKRLKDKGIKFGYWELENGDGGWEPGAYFEDEIFSKKLGIRHHEDIPEPMRKDLDLLFCTEEKQHEA